MVVHEPHLRRLSGSAGDVLGLGCARERWPVEAIAPERLPLVNWRPFREGNGFNPDFSGYTAAPAMTGHPEKGWALFVRAGCWTQRSSTEMPPAPGMVPRRIAGIWRWVLPEAERRADG